MDVKLRVFARSNAGILMALEFTACFDDFYRPALSMTIFLLVGDSDLQLPADVNLEVVRSEAHRELRLGLLIYFPKANLGWLFMSNFAHHVRRR